MNLKSNYQKFKKHLKTSGIIYAFWRGIKYFIFLAKWYRDRKKISQNIISKGKIQIIYSGNGIKIYWDEVEVTQGVGLNCGINTLGLWTDSSFADWQILQRGSDYFDFRVALKNLPLNQIWRIKIKNEREIIWQIEMEAEEALHIDEARIVSPVSTCYKTWINNYKQADFPCLSTDWHSVPLDNICSFLVGVRFPKEEVFLPSLALEVQEAQPGNIYPVIQNSPLEINAHLIGFKRIDSEEKKDYQPGCYNLFSVKISLFSDDYLLDKKIEGLRQNLLQTTIQDKVGQRKAKQKMSVLLANLPWQRDGKWGVRAGSRWPHIKDRSENNYLPFPFFLAYATSLLLENGIDAGLIDSIAEAVPEDDFLEKISRRDFDILVVETSIPSFYYDMKIIKKMLSKGIFVVLCGPHPEIYKPEFLKGNNCIDFVLFGEYEFTLLELVKAIFQGKRDFSSVNGLIWRDQKNNVVKNRSREPFELDSLPWPYREDNLPMEKYWDLPGDIPHPSAQMVASRGCPFGCNFCLWPQVLFGGKTYRTRGVNDVVNEMEHLIVKQGFKSIYFDDDTFNIGKGRMIRLCNEIIRRKLHKVPWAIMAKSDLMDEETLGKMKEAGLYAVKYGVESASQELVDRCGKNLDLKKTERIIKYTKSLGINVHLTFSFGLSGETKETIKSTIDYALRLDPHSVQFSIITPFPGTALFEELDKRGRILTKDFSMYDGHSSCVFQPDNLTPADLEEAKQYAYRLWVDYQRRKRGFLGDIKEFFNYWQNHSLGGTFRKTKSYLNYLYLDRRKFIGKL